jgi:hypothetical protein
MNAGPKELNEDFIRSLPDDGWGAPNSGLLHIIDQRD